MGRPEGRFRLPEPPNRPESRGYYTPPPNKGWWQRHKRNVELRRKGSIARHETINAKAQVILDYVNLEMQEATGRTALVEVDSTFRTWSGAHDYVEEGLTVALRELRRDPRYKVVQKRTWETSEGDSMPEGHTGIYVEW